MSRTSFIDITDIVDKRKRNKRSHEKRTNRNKRAKSRTDFSHQELDFILKMIGISSRDHWKSYLLLGYLIT